MLKRVVLSHPMHVALGVLTALVLALWRSNSVTRAQCGIERRAAEQARAVAQELRRARDDARSKVDELRWAADDALAEAAKWSSLLDQERAARHSKCPKCASPVKCPRCEPAPKCAKCEPPPKCAKCAACEPPPTCTKCNACEPAPKCAKCAACEPPPKCAKCAKCEPPPTCAKCNACEPPPKCAKCAACEPPPKCDCGKSSRDRCTLEGGLAALLPSGASENVTRAAGVALRVLMLSRAGRVKDALGLEPGASDSEVRRACRRLMPTIHPDKQGQTAPPWLADLCAAATKELTSCFNKR